jgi:hypothetical protein
MAGKLTDYLVALENHRDPVQVRGQVDQTVNRLVTALWDRAREPAPS